MHLSGGYETSTQYSGAIGLPALSLTHVRDMGATIRLVNHSMCSRYSSSSTFLLFHVNIFCRFWGENHILVGVRCFFGGNGIFEPQFQGWLLQNVPEREVYWQLGRMYALILCFLSCTCVSYLWRRLTIRWEKRRFTPNKINDIKTRFSLETKLTSIWVMAAVTLKITRYNYNQSSVKVTLLCYWQNLGSVQVQATLF